MSLSADEQVCQLYRLAPRESLNIDRTTAKEIITLMATFYEIRLYWFDNRTDKCAGYFKQGGINPGIYIGDSSTLCLLNVFFHELGHLYCVRNGLWKAYHEKPYITKSGRPRIRRRTARIAKLTGYRAECWVDKWAKKEMATWFPNIYYYGLYISDPSTKQWLMKHHLIPFYNRFLK